MLTRGMLLMPSFQILSELRCSPSCTRGIILGSEPICPPDCFQYKGTVDVFLKVVRQVMQRKCRLLVSYVSINILWILILDIFANRLFQEGFGRLWRGTNAGLALAIPTVSLLLCHTAFCCAFCCVIIKKKLLL